MLGAKQSLKYKLTGDDLVVTIPTAMQNTAPTHTLQL
jgi:alpha-L-fucosidase